MNELERKIKAKIPGEDTGIEIRRSLCDICSPGAHCGVDLYIKDGKIIKVEGTENHPMNNGKLCTKGAANREYVYREDRIKTPLKRVGKRGEGLFKEISWDEAYDEIAQRLNKTKAEHGAEAVAFFTGFSKWYRPMFRRFAYSFGSQNYGSESSCCYLSAYMAWKVMAGDQANPDMANSDLFLGWAYNPYYSNYLAAQKATELKAKGLKFIIIDTRSTPATEKLADLALYPRSGTDGALALCMANILVENDWIDKDFISKYTHGFEEYKEYLKGFNESNVESLTGVPYKDVYKAASMIHESRSMCVKESSAPLMHHKNGFQNYRAIMSLLALTGNVDRKGGQYPAEHTYIHADCGFVTREEEVSFATFPKDAKLPAGAERFPLWYDLEHEMQAMDMPRQILEGKPYPIKSLFSLGMNARMWPNTKHVFDALESLDFFVDCDLFLTDTAKYADIVLPSCSSFERGEFKPYPNGYATYTKPAIKPLYEAKPDTDILCELAKRLDLPDELLKSGYREYTREIIRDLPITIEDLEKSDMPIKFMQVPPREDYAYLKKGLKTPTGKYEFKSERIASHPQWGLDALPTYVEPMNHVDAAKYPFILNSGGRIPNALHSRFHLVPSARSLRPEPMADMSCDDAEKLQIKYGDDIIIYTDRGEITVKANPTITMPSGTISMYHGYSEADVNLLMDENHLDPYSGFPAFRSTRCAVRKKENV